MQPIKKNQAKFILALFVFLLPCISFAVDIDGVPCDLSGRICNPIEIDSIPELIKSILEGALKIGIPILALAIIYCGFLFVAARGNPEKISTAKSALIWTLVGGAVLLGSWAIAEGITTTIKELA